MTTIRCVFCGSVPEDGVDDVFVTDFEQHPHVSICEYCAWAAIKAVSKWAAGKIEYESWRTTK